MTTSKNFYVIGDESRVEAFMKSEREFEKGAYYSYHSAEMLRQSGLQDAADKAIMVLPIEATEDNLEIISILSEWRIPIEFVI